MYVNRRARARGADEELFPALLDSVPPGDRICMKVWQLELGVQRLLVRRRVRAGFYRPKNVPWPATDRVSSCTVA